MTTTDDTTTEMPAAEAEYRARARTWLLEHTEPLVDDTGFSTTHWMPDLEREAAHHAKGQAFQRTLWEGGYSGITIPTEYGGQGGEPWMEKAFREEGADRQIRGYFAGSIAAMAIPAILRHGTEDQKRAYVPTLLNGDLSWCQLFSEPGAGSDLAGLACRAERDGDEFVITGQKVWNSAAMYADMGILLVRTDPDKPKHQGITFLLFDMRQPGVEVRPLVQANGAGHFAEVFIDGARCPVANVVGEIDAGWGPARVVLSNESAMIGGATGKRPDKLIELARSLGLADDRVTRQGLADVWARNRLLGLLGQRLVASMRSGTPLHPSILKLRVTDLRRREGDVAAALLGAAGVATTHEASEWVMELLHARYSISIGGGTDEVHHNNLGEQALGLPRDVRFDKDVPWREVPRS